MADGDAAPTRGPRGIPAIVVGSRDLNTRFRPRLNVATDGDEIAQLLVDGGASAYFFERPEENRVYPIPGGAAAHDPRVRDGHARLPLGAQRPQHARRARRRCSATAAILLAEVDVAQARPARRNRAPVRGAADPARSTTSSLQAVDGTLLRRSRPALFQGLGRRPLAGDRWGPLSGGGDPQPPGSDP